MPWAGAGQSSEIACKLCGTASRLTALAERPRLPGGCAGQARGTRLQLHDTLNHSARGRRPRCAGRVQSECGEATAVVLALTEDEQALAEGIAESLRCSR